MRFDSTHHTSLFTHHGLLFTALMVPLNPSSKLYLALYLISLASQIMTAACALISTILKNLYLGNYGAARLHSGAGRAINQFIVLQSL